MLSNRSMLTLLIPMVLSASRALAAPPTTTELWSKASQGAAKALDAEHAVEKACGELSTGEQSRAAAASASAAARAAVAADLAEVTKLTSQLRQAEKTPDLTRDRPVLQSAQQTLDHAFAQHAVVGDQRKLQRAAEDKQLVSLGQLTTLAASTRALPAQVAAAAKAVRAAERKTGKAATQARSANQPSAGELEGAWTSDQMQANDAEEAVANTQTSAAKVASETARCKALTPVNGGTIKAARAKEDRDAATLFKQYMTVKAGFQKVQSALLLAAASGPGDKPVAVGCDLKLVDWNKLLGGSKMTKDPETNKPVRENTTAHAGYHDTNGNGRQEAVVFVETTFGSDPEAYCELFVYEADGDCLVKKRGELCGGACRNIDAFPIQGAAGYTCESPDGQYNYTWQGEELKPAR